MTNSNEHTKNIEKILVTSALPYANGPIHFGHIAGAYLPADIFVRYKRMTGADVLYVCGSDDHGVAITITAEAHNRTPQEHVRINHELIKSIFDRINIKFDNFSQTSLPAHYELSQRFFLRLIETGLIETKETDQYYCEKCDRFLADRYITGGCPHCGFDGARGDECGKCGEWLEPAELKNPTCKVCGAVPQLKTTRNWFLKLGEPGVVEWLTNWIKEKERPSSGPFDSIDAAAAAIPAFEADTNVIPWKDIVIREVQGYLNRGLQSRAITRDLKWGVPVPLPEGANKVLYVWFDAPIGYISSTIEYLKERRKETEYRWGNRWEDWWKDKDCKLYHFIGKDNIPFHAMIFPIMLKYQEDDFNLPDFVCGNAFLNLEGRQFSKSEGWYIDPLEFLDKYKVDSLRYYLCAEMPENSDAEFRWEGFQACHNSQLTNVYANLVNRTLKFIESKFGGKVPALTKDFMDWEVPQEDGIPPSEIWSVPPQDHPYHLVMSGIINYSEFVGRQLNKFEFRAALGRMIRVAHIGNIFFDHSTPWKSLTENPEKCAETIRICLVLIKTLAVLSYPFIPDTATRVWNMLGCPGGEADISKIPWNEAGKDTFTEGATLPKPEPLFARIDDKQIAAEKAKLGGGEIQPLKKKKTEDPVPALRKNVTIDDFSKLDLRVGKVIEAENVQGSFKLLKMKIDIGLEQRQILAGIAQYYKPEEILGKKVIIAANLEPRKLMGLESQGMVLAASSEDGIVVLTPAGDAIIGSRVS